MTTVQVIVDDRIEDDSILDFEGTWETGGVQVEFNSTTQYTRSKGASNTLHFDGSSVRLVSTLFDGSGTLNLSYTIDSGTPKTVQLKETNSIGYHTTFFDEKVPDGQHTLTTTLDDEGITFCMDYFVYATTLERIVQLKKPVTVLVDNTDTSNIIYGGSWAATTTRRTALGYTEHITSSAGSNATFSFYGTYVGVFGTITPATASSMYSIDNSTPAIFNSPQTSSQQSGQKLFEQTLDDGPHNLVITLRNDAEFGLDYIVYKPSLSEAVYGRPFPSLPSGSTTPSPSTPSESEKASASSSNTGAIVGGVVGGVVGLLAIGFAVLFFFRRKRKSAPQHPPDLDGYIGGPPENYVATTNRGYSPVMTQDFDPLSLHPPSTVANSTYGVSPSITSGTTTWASDTQSRAQDGGVRVLAPVDDESLNPPAYHPNYPTSRVKT